MFRDDDAGSDTWCLARGFAAVTVLGLAQQLLTPSDAAALAANADAVRAATELARAAAASLGLEFGVGGGGAV
jgi:hypothetical protein